MRQRVSRDFELKGAVQRVFAGLNKNREKFVMLTVGGFTFFLPEEFHADSAEWRDGDLLTIRGESAGETVRNGNRQPVHEIYEIVPDISVGMHKSHFSGNGGALPKVEKSA